MFRTVNRSLPCTVLTLVVSSVVLMFPAMARGGPTDLKIGIAAAKITPARPIRMAGYASRKKPSEGVLLDLYAKAMVFEDNQGERGLLITADVIGFNAKVADFLCESIAQETGLERRQIMLNPSHTHTGPVIGIPGATSYELEGEEAECVHEFAKTLADKLTRVSAEAIADLKPGKLSWGLGVTGIVMNRREFTDSGIRLGFNPRGYVDRSVPVLRVDTTDGQMRAVVFGCACHNTTLTGQHFVLSGDYAGFAQQYIEKQHPGVQAMFMIGCGGSANPYPRGTVEAAQVNGRSLGAEVCRVLSESLVSVQGPMQVMLEHADLPLEPVPPRDQLEVMAKGPSYIAFNARQMLTAVDQGQPMPTEYSAPFALWQFGDDLTLVAMSGEVVNGYVPLIESALGPRKLWIAAYANDCFGYLPTREVFEQGGYETRCLYTEPGFFAPHVQEVVIEKITEMAKKAGRQLPNP
jgi:hypothetical protein